SNAIGTDKLQLLVIGSSIEPQALVGINHQTLPVTYRSNENAWIRSDIFGKWLETLDKKFRLENRQILLLIDGAACHFDLNKTTANIPSNAQDTSDDEESTN
ncbi:632_t:CDS:1, partial [Racocetra fulgida]